MLSQLFGICVFLSAFYATEAEAQSLWTGNTNNEWNNSGNWSGSGIPNGSTDDAFFPTSGSNRDIDLLGGTFDVRNLEFSPTTNNYSIGTSVGTGTLNLHGNINISAAGETIDFDNDIIINQSANGSWTNTGGIFTVGASLSGTGNIAMDGDVTLTNTSSSHTGTFSVQSGTTTLSSANALQSSSVEVGASGTLRLNGVDANIGSLAGSGTVDLDAQRLLAGANNASTTFSGTFNTSGNNQLLKMGTGTLTLDGPSKTFGSLRAFNGTVNVNTDLDLTNEIFGTFLGPLSAENGTINIQNGAQVTFSDTSIARATSVNGAINITGSGSLLSGRRLDLAPVLTTQTGNVTVSDTATLNISQRIQVGSFGTGNFNVQSGGTVTLDFLIAGLQTDAVGNIHVTGSNSTINAQRMGLGGETTSLRGGTGNLLVEDGGFVQVAGQTTFWTDLGSGITVNGGSFWTDTFGAFTGVTGSIALTNPTGSEALRVGINNGSSTFDGIISDASGGSGGFRKVGTGTFTLTGANTFTGDTVIEAGTVVVSNVNALQSSTVNVGASGTLQLDGVDANIGSLAGSGTVDLGSQRLLAGANDASTTFSGTFNTSGTNQLLKMGTGTLTLDGASKTFGSLRAFNGTVNVNTDLDLTNDLFGTFQGPLSAENGTINIQNGAQVTFSTTTAARATSVNGAITITGAGSLLSGRRLDLTANNSTEVGNVTVSDTATLNISERIQVGSFGTGNFNVQSGGSVTLDFLIAGLQTDAVGNIHVTGSNSSINAQRMGLGGETTSLRGGTGNLVVENGGFVQVAGQTAFWTDLGSGITVDGGSFWTDTFGAFTGVTGSIALTNPIGSEALRVGINNGSSTFDGVISDAARGPGGFNKVGTGTFTLTNASNSYSGGTRIEGGSVIVDNTAMLGTGRVSLNGGNLEMTGSSTLGLNLSVEAGGGSLITSGRTQLHTSNSIAGGTLTSTTGLELGASDTFTGFGILSTGSSESNGFLNDGMVTGSGPGSGDLIDFVGYVSGTGSYAGTVRFSETFSPGASPALIQLENAEFANTNTLIIELGGVLAGSQYDQLDLSGDLTLDGLLDVTLIDSFSLDLNQEFLIADVEGILSGTFTGLNNGDIVGTYGGVDLYISYDGGDGNDVLLFTVPEPTTGALLLAGLGYMALRRRR